MLRKTETLQGEVEEFYSDLAERASDTLGNIALVQSFTRIEMEVRGLRQVARSPAWRATAGALDGGRSPAR